jgi:hypothetical protein
LWKGGEDDDEGEQERERGDERAEWYGSWPSEKEDACVWKEVKPVCAELTVPLGARLNREARERRLDARLWCRARRSIEGVRGGIVKVGVESSPSAPTSLSLSGMVWWTTAGWVSSTRMMSTGPDASMSSS